MHQARFIYSVKCFYILFTYYGCTHFQGWFLSLLPVGVTPTTLLLLMQHRKANCQKPIAPTLGMTPRERVAFVEHSPCAEGARQCFLRASLAPWMLCHNLPPGLEAHGMTPRHNALSQLKYDELLCRTNAIICHTPLVWGRLGLGPWLWVVVLGSWVLGRELGILSFSPH